MRLPNGYGGVSKLSGKRRCPWRVRVTDKYEYDPVADKFVQKYKTLGYYESKAKALQALAEYNEHPYNIDEEKTTFAELYEKWTSEYFEQITPSAARTVKAAYAYCSSLYNLRMKDIRVYHLKKTIEEGYILDNNKRKYASANTKSRIKSMLNLLFDYACERDVVDKNYARLFSLGKEVEKEKRQNKKDTTPFTSKEVQSLWENISFPYVDMVIIDIYTGLRPQELCSLLVENIDLKNDTIIGGMKTDAGRNRIIPIHKDVKSLIQARYDEALQNNRTTLFSDENGQILTYDKYKTRFKNIINHLGMKHRPHECRHSFITFAKASKMDEYCLKLIVGHAIKDITEEVYTHRTIEQLKEEMNKFAIGD